MDITIRDAAQRLNVSEPRVRQLLRAGDLRGRRLGRAWLIDADDVARLQSQRRPSGRPLGPKRAWALIDLMSGGKAPWLSYSERSQVRGLARSLDPQDADQWRGILRGRTELRPVQAHPAAVDRLARSDGALLTGPAEAMRRGFDLVASGRQRTEIYLHLDEWDSLEHSLALRPSHEGNLLIRHPMVVWPFDGRETVPDAAIAADLLNSPEPRVVRAGELVLNELLRRFQEELAR